MKSMSLMPVSQKKNIGTLPKISVITIVRNGAQFIEQTINSVVDQSYTNKEYIIIDGDSNDGTVDIIRRHETQVAKWISEPDAGIADAFNKGLSLATGDYILFLNSDDALASPVSLATMADGIVANDFPVLIYGDCDVLERGSGTVLHRASIDFSPRRMKCGQMLPHPSLLARRTYFDKYGAFDMQFKIGVDYEWLLRGALHERVVHLPVLMTNVRAGGISTQNRARVVDEIILALKKNRYISSAWGEYKLRGYFLLRALAKAILAGTGLYRA